MNLLKKIGLALAISVGAVTGAFATDRIDKLANSTYKLYSGNTPICSTEAISPTQLVTANHCVGEPNLNIRHTKLDDSFKVISEDVWYLKTVRTSKEYDQAMLEVIDTSKKFEEFVTIAKPDEFKPGIGDELFTIGYPKVMEITLTKGEFSSFASLTDMDSDMKKPFYKTTIPVTGGNSGGGLYSFICGEVDKTPNKAAAYKCEYKLVGLTTGGFRDVSFMNYFSTVEGLNSLVANLIRLDTPSEGASNELIEADKLINPSDHK